MSPEADKENTNLSLNECNFIWSRWKNTGAGWWRWWVSVVFHWLLHTQNSYSVKLCAMCISLQKEIEGIERREKGLGREEQRTVSLAAVGEMCQQLISLLLALILTWSPFYPLFHKSSVITGSSRWAKCWLQPTRQSWRRKIKDVWELQQVHLTPHTHTHILSESRSHVTVQPP